VLRLLRAGRRQSAEPRYAAADHVRWAAKGIPPNVRYPISKVGDGALRSASGMVPGRSGGEGVYGALLDAAHRLREDLTDLGEPTRALLVAAVETAAATWTEPDHGV